MRWGYWLGLGCLPCLSWAGGGTQGQNADNQAANNQSTTFEAADPLSMATREYYFERPLLNLGGPLPLGFTIGYASGNRHENSRAGLPGKFTHSHYAASFSNGSPLRTEVVLPLGEVLRFEFDPDSNSWFQFTDQQIRHQWIETAEYFYLVDPLRQQLHSFRKLISSGATLRAVRVRLQDRNGNTHHYSYPPTGTSTLDTEAVRRGPMAVEDGLGRRIELSFAELGQFQLRHYITRIEDHTGRAWTLNHEVGPPDNPIGGIVPLVTLRSLVDPLGGAWRFGYQGNNRIASLQHPAGQVPVTQTYDSDFDAVQVLTQTNALGDQWTLTGDDFGQPGLGDSRVDLTNPDGSVRSFFHRSNKTLMGAVVDELGHTTRFFQEPERRAVGLMRDADNGESRISYDPVSGLIAAVENNRGDVTQFTYAAVEQSFSNPDNGETIVARFFDRVRVDYPDGAMETATFDGRGNPLQITDRRGQLHQYSYNGFGQWLSYTNPAGGVVSRSFDARGDLLSRSDTDTGQTDFVFDPLSRLVRIDHPDGSQRLYHYDALDRLVELTDERGTRSQFQYDASSRLLGWIRDAGGALTQLRQFLYDGIDRLISATDPAGHSTTYDYPYFEQPSHIHHPDGTQTQLEYDLRRLPSAVVDEAGQRTEIGRDGVGAVSSLTSPELRTVAIVRDAISEMTARVAPGGDTTTYTRDPLSRVTAVTDALQRVHAVQRDDGGLVVQRSEPEATLTAYSHDGNGQLDGVGDANGQLWLIARTPMGRLSARTDPLGRVWQQSFDSRGRPLLRQPADGIDEQRSYDGRNALTRRAHGDGTAQHYSYDALGRLIGTLDEIPEPADGSLLLQNLAVGYAYDERDNPTDTHFVDQHFVASYDSRNRLIALDYAGQLTVSYQRDARGLVTRVSDDRSGAAVDLSYDDDRRLIQLTRANGTVTHYSYDAKGRITVIDHGALGRLDFSYNAADEPIAIDESGFTLSAGAALQAASQSLSVDAASQISTAGFSHDARGRVTAAGARQQVWDGAGRLLGIGVDGDVLLHRYSATGQLLVRGLASAASDTTEFHRSHAIAGQPVLAERRAGSYTRFTVTLPDGTPLYLLQNASAVTTGAGATLAVRYYHYGKVGETRLLSNAAGAVTDAYAYDGFGRLLAQSGSSDQHFRFNGQFGVRTDLLSGLVQMRARWYDPELGRFLSPDPIFDQLLTRNGQHTNPYHYAANQVTYRVDPSGLDAFFNDLWVFSEGVFDAVDDISPRGLDAGPTSMEITAGNTTVSVSFTDPGAVGPGGVQVLTANDLRSSFGLLQPVFEALAKRRARQQRRDADLGIGDGVRALAKGLTKQQRAGQGRASTPLRRLTFEQIRRLNADQIRALTIDIEMLTMEQVGELTAEQFLALPDHVLPTATERFEFGPEPSEKSI